VDLSGGETLVDFVRLEAGAGVYSRLGVREKCRFARLLSAGSMLLLLGAEMDRDEDRRNQEVQRWQAYLSVLARLHLDPGLRDRIDLSGVVQQTLLEAYQRRGLLRIEHPAQELAWLRRILANILADELRKLATEKRDVGREQSLQAALEGTSARLEVWLAADQSSPSEVAQRNEQAMQLAVALAELPESQREALVLQHWHGWSMDEIAAHLGRTRVAVASLIKRGLTKLRERLPPPE
jgi:RNA polymerase sigma-70 factor (ECF subfamily)